MCSPSAPAAPNYYTLAEDTAKANKELAEYTTRVNRPTEVTPYGTRTWTTDRPFDEEGYNAAVKEYQDRLKQRQDSQDSQDSQTGQTGQTGAPPSITGVSSPYGYGEPTGGITPSIISDVSQSITGSPDARIEEPNREDFYGDEQWTSTIEFSPEVQRIIDSVLGSKGALADLGIDAAERVKESISQPLVLPEGPPEYSGVTTPIPTLEDFGETPTFTGAQGEVPVYIGVGGDVPTFSGVEGTVPTYQAPKEPIPEYVGPQGDLPQFAGAQGQFKNYDDYRQNVEQKMLQRVESDIQRDRQGVHDQLVAQGIPPGSEAYNRQMEQIDQRLTDARQQAEIAATDVAGREYQQYLAGRRTQQGEAKDVFDAAMRVRGLSSEEARAKFVADMERRGMSRQDALDTYSSLMEGRRQEQSEALDKFSADLESRGVERQEALDLFDNAMRTRGVTQQEARDKFAADLQSYGIDRQKALDIFNSLLAVRQEERAEGLTEYQSDMDTYRQQIVDILTERNVPINELAAILSGSQVDTPQFGPAGQMPYVPGPDYVGAGTQTYQSDIAGFNADQARINAILGGLFGVGGAYAGTL